jgi:hypothetical protein
MDAVQIMADQSKIDDTLTNIQTVIDSLKSALSDYCTEEGTNLDAISTKLSTIISLNTDCCDDINTKLGQLYDAIVAIPQYVAPTTTVEPTTTIELTTTVEATTTEEITTSTDEPTTTVEQTTTSLQPTTTAEPTTSTEEQSTTTLESTTTVEQTTTSEEITTTVEICPVWFESELSSKLIFSDTLSFTPDTTWYSGSHSYGSNIVEDDKYIFIVFNKDNHLNHVVYRINKSTSNVTTETIQTDGGYYGDHHKKAVMLITNSGTLLVAIDKCPSNFNHGAAWQIFRWADTDNLASYTSTSVGNSTTERLSYAYLFEVGGDIILEAKNNNTSLPTRRYYISNNDGQNFGVITEYINYGDSDYWVYAGQVGNNSKTNPILGITPAYYTTNQVYQYVTYIRTDFSGDFYELDGTNLGTNITGAELESAYSWGDTVKNTNLMYIRHSKIFGNEIYSIGLIGTRVAGVSNITHNQLFKVNINTGVVTSGNIFAAKYPSNILEYSTLFVFNDDIYVKASYNGDLYYYRVHEDLNDMELICVEENNYHLGLLTDLYSELTADYNTSTGIIRVFRGGNPDTVWDLTTTTAEPTTTEEPTTTSEQPTTTIEPTTTVEPATTSEEPTTTIEPTTTSEQVTTTAEPTTTIEEGTTTTGEIDLSESLISCWGLNETSGTDVIDSYGNNDGTNTNATINQTGIVDKAYDFNGTDAYLTFPAEQFRFNPLTESYSISMWVKSADPSPTASAPYLVSGGSSASGVSYPFFWPIIPASSNELQFLVKNHEDTKITVVINGTNVWDNTWHLITMTVNHNDGYVRAYLDDGLQNSESITFATYNIYDASYIYISRVDTSVSRFYDGLIDSIRIYNKALSINEISALFNSGSGVACPEGSTTTAEVTTTEEVTTTGEPTTTEEVTTTEEPTTTEQPTTTEEVTTTSRG